MKRTLFDIATIGLVAAGMVIGLAVTTKLHARPVPQQAAVPELPHPYFNSPGYANHSIRVSFPTFVNRFPNGVSVLDRTPDGFLPLDIRRYGFNNLKDKNLDHRAMVQFFRSLPAGEQRPEGEAPLYHFELKPAKLRPGGADNFIVAGREQFRVPPGNYSVLVATAGPTGKRPVAEKDPIDPAAKWYLGTTTSYEVMIR